jgi:molybdenum cofactor cytidylyltransferase
LIKNSKPTGVSGILLAAGEAKRMGTLKQVLPLRKTTMLEQTVNNLVASHIDDTIVVLGYKAEEIKLLLANLPVNIVINPDYRAGISTSITAGIKALKSETAAIMVLLADQPFIETSTINLLLKEYLHHKKGIIIPTYHGQPGHPVIISLKYKGELLALRGDIGAREIVSRHQEDILEIEIDSPGIVIDIDTPEMYNKHHNNLK